MLFSFNPRPASECFQHENEHATRLFWSSHAEHSDAFSPSSIITADCLFHAFHVPFLTNVVFSAISRFGLLNHVRKQLETHRTPTAPPHAQQHASDHPIFFFRSASQRSNPQHHPPHPMGPCSRSTRGLLSSLPRTPSFLKNGFKPSSASPTDSDPPPFFQFFSRFF